MSNSEQMILDSGAVFDKSRRYRYRLWRTWNEELPLLSLLMLNPSRADAIKNDQTIRTCIGIGKRFGFGAIEVVNLFAYCATYPHELRAARNPVGKENDAYIADAVQRAKTVLLAWGNHGQIQNRSQQVLSMLIESGAGGNLVCLGKNKSGQPRHPLYVSVETQLLPYQS